MSVQKKSLISQRSAVKAAILANPTQSVGFRPIRASGSPRRVASGSSRRLRPAARAAARPAARAAARPAARAAARPAARAAARRSRPRYQVGNWPNTSERHSSRTKGSQKVAAPFLSSDHVAVAGKPLTTCGGPPGRGRSARRARQCCACRS